MFNIERYNLEAYATGLKTLPESAINNLVKYHIRVNADDPHPSWTLDSTAWAEQIYNYLNDAYLNPTPQEAIWIEQLAGRIFQAYLKALKVY